MSNRHKPGDVQCSIMPIERYMALEHGNDKDGPHLTQEEIKKGWHFCCEWDGLLIGPGMVEMKACQCEIPVREYLKNTRFR